MDTFEHALITQSADGNLLRGEGSIQQFTGNVTGKASDVVAYLEQLQPQGWALIAVEPTSAESRYWLRRTAA